jgi:hypothetical protein
MKAQLNNLAFWLGAVLVVVLATWFYQPSAAKTGSLLVWLDGDLYLQDIDTQALTPVGPAKTAQTALPSPGCLGQLLAPCWIAVGQTIYRLHPDGTTTQSTIPLDSQVKWNDSVMSWSPDGVHLAYNVILKLNRLTELRVYNLVTGETKVIAAVVDPTLPVAWSAGCAQGLLAAGCQLGFKLIVPKFVTLVTTRSPDQSNWLIGFNPLTGKQQIWFVAGAPIKRLRWAYDNTLLYSQLANYFYRTVNNRPAYHISPGSQPAAMSADGRYTVYYESFTLKECQAERPTGGCWYLGVWVVDDNLIDRRFIYSADLAQAKADQLNLDPQWSPRGEAFVFIQAGQLLYYNFTQNRADVWYSGLQAQLVSGPVYSANGAGVALVDKGKGDSPAYRLLVIDPQLKPVEHEIKAQQGFQVLVWLPNKLN